MLRRKSKRFRKMLMREHCKDVSAGDLSWEDFDFKMEYFMGMMSACSNANVEVHIARSKDDFSKLVGREHSGEFSASCGNKVVIFEPSKASETHHDREQFFEILYQQLFTVLYQNRK